MDLKDFQNIPEEDEKVVSTTKNILTETDHDDSDKILKELEDRIHKLSSEVGTAQKTDSTAAVLGNPVETAYTDIQTDANGNQIVEVMDTEDDSFLAKIRPFILPIFLTLFALIFSGIFMYFFSKSRVEKSAQAITNNGNQEVKIEIRQEKPIVKEVVVIPEPVLELEPEPILVVATPTKATFENGTTTVLNVRFSFDKFQYDNHPRGIYLLDEQSFEGDYEDFKLIASNRPYANDYFFGIDRYIVSLIGDCKYIVDDAQILVEDVSEGDKKLSSVGKNYFTGKVLKIVKASKPHVVCNK